MARARGGDFPDIKTLETRDNYREIFRYQALAGQHARLGALQRSLISQQGKDGGWQGPDRWWLAGGQVYATAAAVLALAPQG
jgi:hypothetical protein